MHRVISLAAGAAALFVGAPVFADTLFVNLTGFQSFGYYGDVLNSHITVPMLSGTQITAIDFQQLTFQSEGLSFTDEFVVSVNDSAAAISYWDSTVPGNSAAPGIVGPVSAPFDNPGVLASGPFTMTTNSLYIEVYDLFDNSPAREAIVLSGGIQITYTPVPAPGALALLALASVSARRRRRNPA